MDNLKQFNSMGAEDNWRSQSFRQSVVSKIEEVILRSGVQVARNSSEMENHVFMKAKSREDYMNMVAKLILHVREMSKPTQNQGAPNMQGQNPNQPGPNSQVQNQPGQAPQGPNNQQGMPTDPINALQNMASQGTRNQMMNMGPGQMQQGVMGPNAGMGGMQGQMGQQGPIVSQGPQAQPATNLLQTLNQRPQLNMQHKLGGNIGMVPNQGQMGSNMVGGMGMNMGSQLQSQLAGPGMQGAMMSNISMPPSMQVPMSGANTMGQMQCNQVVGGMGGQMAPNSMQGQMPNQMDNNQQRDLPKRNKSKKLKIVRPHSCSQDKNKEIRISEKKMCVTKKIIKQKRRVIPQSHFRLNKLKLDCCAIRTYFKELLSTDLKLEMNRLNSQNDIPSIYAVFEHELGKMLAHRLRNVQANKRLECYEKLINVVREYES